MRALFGGVSLLVVVAVVGLLVGRQMKALGVVPVQSAASAASAPGSLGGQSRRQQEKIRDDVVRALEQGARKDDPNL